MSEMKGVEFKIDKLPFTYRINKQAIERRVNGVWLEVEGTDDDTPLIGADEWRDDKE